MKGIAVARKEGLVAIEKKGKIHMANYYVKN
jgi:hypothetical protein